MTSAFLAARATGEQRDDDRIAEFVLDTPIMRAFVAEAQAVIAGASSPQDACAAIEPRFAELLAASGWLPDEYQAAVPESGMGGGIGQWLLYRADDVSGDLGLDPPADERHRLRLAACVGHGVRAVKAVPLRLRQRGLRQLIGPASPDRRVVGGPVTKRCLSRRAEAGRS
jgi:hypothetical protein